jgi:hypothetical protein
MGSAVEIEHYVISGCRHLIQRLREYPLDRSRDGGLRHVGGNYYEPSSAIPVTVAESWQLLGH